MSDPFDLVIFDCDGVLVDSEVISARTLVALLGPYGVHIDLEQVYRHFIGRSFPTVAVAIRSQFDVVLPEEFETAYRKRLLETFETDLRPTSGVERVLAMLDIPFCAATSSSPERVARSLAITGLAQFFADRVFTASQVKNGKPAPDLFLHVASTLAVEPSRCLVIEDSPPGIEAAEAAGMTIWRYAGGAHMSKAVRRDDGVPTFDSWAEFFDMMSAAEC